MFRDLPKPEEIGDYEPYLTLDYDKNNRTRLETKVEEPKENKNVFTL